MPELDSTQEEADTRMLLHAKHAGDAGSTGIVIKSPDTDVLMLACHFQQSIPQNMYIHTGTKTRTRYIDIEAVSRKLGPAVCKALPGLHSFTGCDTNGAFAGKGKQRAFDLVVTKPDMCEAMKSIGCSVPVSETTLQAAQTFVCSLYGKPGEDVDELRYQMFCGKGSASHQLPPCSDALRKHTKRANYQALVWRRSLEATPNLPSPDGHGWKVTADEITVDWMDLQPAPKAVLELIKCGCTQGCGGNRCSCVRNRLLCTDCCGCRDCVNTVREDDGNDSETDGDDVT
ncbi:MAG: hypothetical protein ABW185_22465 [Sedimenticola sp.]